MLLLLIVRYPKDLTIVIVILVVARYKMHLNWAVCKGYFTRIDTLITTGQIKTIILEIIIIILGPYEFFNSIDYMEY